MLLSQTELYLKANLLPVLSAVVSAGLMLRMYCKLVKLQQDEDVSSFKIGNIVKKYVGLMIIVNILSSVIYLIDGYFK